MGGVMCVSLLYWSPSASETSPETVRTAPLTKLISYVLSFQIVSSSKDQPHGGMAVPGTPLVDPPEVIGVAGGGEIGNAFVQVGRMRYGLARRMSLDRWLRSCGRAYISV